MSHIDSRRSWLAVDVRYVTLLLQVSYLLATMSTISAFSTFGGLRPFVRPIWPIRIDSRISPRRISTRSFRMGSAPSGEPEKDSGFKTHKFLQQRLYSGKNDSGENSRRRFLRFGLALAAPVIALETWKTLDPSVSSRFQAQAQAGLIGSSIKPPIAESDSKLAPNELNTIR
jgi:hypothetical protein